MINLCICLILQELNEVLPTYIISKHHLLSYQMLVLKMWTIPTLEQHLMLHEEVKDVRTVHVYSTIVRQSLIHEQLALILFVFVLPHSSRRISFPKLIILSKIFTKSRKCTKNRKIWIKCLVILCATTRKLTLVRTQQHTRFILLLSKKHTVIRVKSFHLVETSRDL